MSEVLKEMKERRSIRKYKSEMVPQDVLDKIIEAGLYAASGKGTQNTIIIQVTKKELRDEIAEMNRKIGRDISFIAWDDFELAKILDPPLTTVTQDPQKMGELAAEKLFEKINAKRENKEWLGESTIVLKTQMIERQSCCDINLLK